VGIFSQFLGRFVSSTQFFCNVREYISYFVCLLAALWGYLVAALSNLFAPLANSKHPSLLDRYEFNRLSQLNTASERY
jgi:hypothetical protein